MSPRAAPTPLPVRKYLVKDSVKQTEKEIDYDKPGDDKTQQLACVFSVVGGFRFPGSDVLALTAGLDCRLRPLALHLYAPWFHGAWHP